MVSDADYIVGLMKTETDALGFIPDTTVRTRYIANRQYVIAYDERGRRVGYVLHGATVYGRRTPITQAVIDYDRRRALYGAKAVAEVVSRARLAGASHVTCRCRADLDANAFWCALGFVPWKISPAGARRGGDLIWYSLDLSPLL